MIDENEEFVLNEFKRRFDISLLKLPESPKNQTPDVTFNINGNEIVAEIKTIENAFRINLDTSKMQMNDDGFLEIEQGGEDNTWSRVARAIEKASYQLVMSEINIKAVILLNKDCAISEDLDDILNGYITVDRFKSHLPKGVQISVKNWKCNPSLIFWIDKAKSEFYIRSIGEIPESINSFFREKLNA